MPLEKSQVEHIAQLARLNLTPDEVERFTTELAAVVEYFEKLAEVDTSSVEPFRHRADSENVTRPDQVKDSLTTEQALTNAPESDGKFFHVPRVIG